MLRAATILTLIGLLSHPARAEEAGVVIEGSEGPGKGKHIVLIAADDEYRSEELIPQLAKILAKRQGFKCTVLFAVDPEGKVNPGQKDHIPGLAALKTADLLVFFARFRELPDDQMKLFVDYLNSGKPLISLRTSTHAFNYTKHRDSPYARYSYNSKDPAGGFGREVVGETWVNHYGKHQQESTRGLIASGMEEHPIVKGVEDIWGPSDVYGINSLTGDSKPIIMGQVLTGMEPTDKPNPSMTRCPSPGSRLTPARRARSRGCSRPRWDTPATSRTRGSAGSWSTPASGAWGWKTRSRPGPMSTSWASTTPSRSEPMGIARG